jgi:competence protein ComFC
MFELSFYFCFSIAKYKHLRQAKIMIVDNVLEIIAPFNCVRCGSEGSLVCAQCKNKIVHPKRSTCVFCNALTADFKLCARCKRSTRIKGVIISSHYEGEVKTLIRLLKYERAQRAAKYLAELLAPYVNARGFDAITWVPISSRRFRQRGYNQSKLIARYLAWHTKLPYFETLGRMGHQRQVGTARSIRLIQLRGSMYPIKPKRFSGLRVLIVDDVVTTGATMSECADVLYGHGAKEVWGAAIAKH